MATDFQQLHQKFERSGPPWIEELRQKGLNRFEKLGWPTKQQEAWKYTNVKEIAATQWNTPSPSGEGARRADEGLPGNLPPGVKILKLSEAIEQEPELIKTHLNQCLDQDHPFIALNTAFLQEGVFIHLSPGTLVEKPIELNFNTQVNGSATMTQPRILILAEAGSQATIIENYRGSSSQTLYFTNTVTEIITKESAVINHYKIQEENSRAFHLASLGILQHQDSSLNSFNLALGSALARQEITSQLFQPGASCQLKGLYLGADRQHLDTQTKIEHQSPHCTSLELYKGILDHESRGVFNGQIIVKPGAQKTHSSLTNKNLLLSKKAKVDTKPLLEIFADDVKCSHGATIGRLDETQVFYLRSRGIRETQARKILTYAFAREVFEEVSVPEIKEKLDKILSKRFSIY